MKLSAMLVAVAAGSAMAVPHHRKRASPFQWFGVNESGAEFGENNLPGVYGTDYIWPEPSAISTLAKAGMNIFRVQFKMERLTPDGMTGAYNEDYLANLTATVDAVNQAGAHAILDPHNYGRFNDEIITSTSDFQTFWENLAGKFKDNNKVIFDTNNEYNTMDQELVLNLNQAAIDGIRAAGATEQYIFVEGNQWSGAWSWVDVNDNMKALTDPQDKIIYEMHQYLDSDSSGTSETCVSGTIGQERVSSATQWLRSNGKKGIIGEFAGASNDVCRTAVTGMLNYLSNNTDVWTGAVWWAAGPWWADYMFNMEPPSGPAYTGMLDVVQPFMVA
ncbi:endoglucanase 3 precursor [Aspergillus terreus]|nr:endoglucanase 3 precursor [Aspergillus terreus]